MNKPVAWMHKEATAWLSCTNQHPETEINEWIPLYTHPAELTDEEIKELAMEYLENTGKGIVGVYDFVRAILQKANNG